MRRPDANAAERLRRFNDCKSACSSTGAVFAGQRRGLVADHDASPGGISEANYRALARTFNPVQFDPVALVRLAKAAGQRYMVITTKHHDGFCMFDSSFTANKSPTLPTRRTSSPCWQPRRRPRTCRWLSTTRRRT